MMAAYSEAAVLTVWGWSLVVGVAVLLVVGFLLSRILSTAETIESVAGRIWVEGKMVANNTIQIPLFLSTTLAVVGRILSGAGQIAEAARAIQEHADGCPGCPACMRKADAEV